MKYQIPLLLIGLCVALTGCAGKSTLEPRATALAARGPIEQLTAGADRSRISVGAGLSSGDGCGIVATVDRKTHYLQRLESGNLRPISLADLSRGDTVEVYAEGIILDSCPGKGYASAIVRVTRA